MNDQKNKQANLGITIFFFLVAVLLIGFSVKQQLNSERKEEELTKRISEQVTKEVVTKVEQTLAEQTLSKPSEFPDFDSLSRLKKLLIVEDFESWTPEANVKDDKIKKVIVVEKGTLAKGYIYIRASLDNKALTKWESIYLKLDDIGGHLFRSQSLKVPEGEKTQLLYALDNIPYLQSVPYSESRVPISANWFQLFGDKSEIEVLTFISSLRPAKVEEVSLYYGCVDDSECLLELKK